MLLLSCSNRRMGTYCFSSDVVQFFIRSHLSIFQINIYRQNSSLWQNIQTLIKNFPEWQVCHSYVFLEFCSSTGILSIFFSQGASSQSDSNLFTQANLLSWWCSAIFLCMIKSICNMLACFVLLMQWVYNIRVKPSWQQRRCELWPQFV